MSSMGASNGSSQLARWRDFITAGDEGIRFSAQLQATITPQAAPAASQLMVHLWGSLRAQAAFHARRVQPVGGTAVYIVA